MKVLIVEDSPIIASIVKKKLNGIECEVKIVENGEEAIKSVFFEQPDLILMDTHMPVLDGYETTKLLRRNGFKNKIITVSASAMQVEKEKALKSGADLFIAKPLPSNFNEIIRHELYSTID